MSFNGYVEVASDWGDRPLKIFQTGYMRYIPPLFYGQTVAVRRSDQ